MNDKTEWDGRLGCVMVHYSSAVYNIRYTLNFAADCALTYVGGSQGYDYQVQRKGPQNKAGVRAGSSIKPEISSATNAAVSYTHLTLPTTPYV